jgi:hypothetical protein
VETNSTGGQGSRRAVAPSDDDDDDDRLVYEVHAGNATFGHVVHLAVWLDEP